MNGAACTRLTSVREGGVLVGVETSELILLMVCDGTTSVSVQLIVAELDDSQPGEASPVEQERVELRRSLNPLAKICVEGYFFFASAKPLRESSLQFLSPRNTRLGTTGRTDKKQISATFVPLTSRWSKVLAKLQSYGYTSRTDAGAATRLNMAKVGATLGDCGETLV
eukprot:CAMPEP_0171513180 /NCGR_PEP_ID=MMETSP0959-20130129/2068_1 /TAXON_ID=87120 /ORGANISM="Aurantiochytrium limacinum, Strain ATCCMYA-1381" /LENGTH=167 /DNA_ID=CAMNT_0012051211 /DNA_START=443 /DNA_END=946 /DNA_ORIENTATION=-